jgi:hypothetical protein
MAKIQIQLSSKRSFIAKAIRWLTRGEFNHVDIVMPGGKLIGAFMGFGVREFYYDRAKYLHVKRYQLEVTPELVEWVYSQKGRKYDILAILAFIFRFKLKKNSPTICSELALDFLKKTVICNEGEYGITFNSAKISPRDIHLILQTLESTGKVILSLND